MFGGLPFWLVPEDWKERERERLRKEAEAEKRYFEEVLAPNAVDWDPSFGKKGLNSEKKVCFKASTFNVNHEPLFLFDTKPCELSQANLTAPHENDLVGPVIKHGDRENTWIYRHAILPRGESLWLRFGNAKGDCYFDGDIIIPILYNYRPWHWERKFLVWMSHRSYGDDHSAHWHQALLRPCLHRRVRDGVVPRAGGHAKRSVKSIVVVERSRELIDWFARGHAERVAEKTGTPIDIVCEDVFPYLAEHHEKFDKIALDIFKSYGNNNPEDDVRVRDLLYPDNNYYRWNSKPIEGLKKKLWCWGSVKIGRQERIRYI